MPANLRTRHADIFGGQSATFRYVAFVDILGFGRQVEEKFDDTVDIYKTVLQSTDLVHGEYANVQIQVASDAFVVTSDQLLPVVRVVNAIHFQTLMYNCVVRGGIGFGQHIEAIDRRNSYVVSQGLVQAVRLEKTVRFPCVQIHPSIEIPRTWWTVSGTRFEKPVLWFDGMQIVNPFNIAWGRSANHRFSMLGEEFPEHKDKYEWLMRLYQAVVSGDRLVPEHIRGDKNI